MAEYIRVVEFEADDAAIDVLLREIGSAGAPEGVNATRITGNMRRVSVESYEILLERDAP